MLDVAAVIVVHDEREMAWRAIRSAKVAIERAEKEGVRAGIQLVLSKAKTETVSLLIKHAPDLMYSALSGAEDGDLGEARNIAVRDGLQARHYAMLDGDDIWGKDWLWRGVKYLDAMVKDGGCEDGKVVAHPQINSYFGAQTWWFQHKDQREPSFDADTFMDTNYWTSACMAPRELLLAHPYRRHAPGFGFEDWEWHKRTIAEGVLHVTVPETVHFIRRRAHSLSDRASKARCLPAPSKYETADPTTFKGKLKGFKPPPVGDWLDRQWKAAHLMEPALWPDPGVNEKRSMYQPQSHAGASSRVACQALQGFHTILVTARLSKGGADRMIAEHAAAALAAGKTACVVVTEAAGKPADFPCPVFSLPEWEARPEARLAVLLRALLSSAPKALHVINSAGGFVCVREHAQSFKTQGTRLYASLFCEDRPPFGQRSLGYAFDGTYASVQDKLDLVFTDNHVMRERLIEQMGTDPDRIVVLNSPVDDAVEKPSPSGFTEAAGVPIKVLWASRWCWQKAPNLLLAITQESAAKNLPIIFSIRAPGFGLLPALAGIEEQLKALPNVHLDTRPWQSWAELNENFHDVMLYTSHWDGKPIVALDALINAMPVVTSAEAGDLPIVASESLGGTALPSEWLDAIVGCAKDRDLRGDIAQRRVAEAHSRQQFRDALTETGYHA